MLDAPIDVQSRRRRQRRSPTCAARWRFEPVSLDHRPRQSRVLDERELHARPGHRGASSAPAAVGKSTIACLATRLLDPDSGVVRLDGRDLRALRAGRRPPAHRPRRAGADAAARHHRGEHPLRLPTSASRSGHRRTCDGPPRRPGIARLHRRAARRDTPPMVGERGLAVVGRRAAAHRAGARVPRQPGGAGAWMNRPRRSIRSRSAQVIEGYRAVMRGRTTLLITHRREVAMAADHVVVLDGARVVQAGRPAGSDRAAGHVRAPVRPRGCGNRRDS